MAKMTVRSFLNVAVALPPHVSILLRGDHGIGKSQVMRRLAKLIAESEGRQRFPFIDRRLSQMTEGDLVGLPKQSEFSELVKADVTRFAPPEWFMQAVVEPCYLFLDEFNRGTQELMNGGFQVVLDYELNGFQLHKDSRVGAAINTNARYSVNEMDPALIDRFFVVDLAPDVNDWLEWARDPEQGNIEPVIVDFIAQGDQWLDPSAKADLRQKQPSRRSWERYSKALNSAKIADDPEHPNFYLMGLGFIGTEATIKFHEFAKSHDVRFSGRDILDDYSKVKQRINRLGQEKANIAIDKVCDYVQKEVTKLTDKQGQNLAAFFKDLSGELKVTCWSKLTADGVERLELAKSIHKHIAPLVLDVFNVPMGEAGIGVIPNIPGVYNKAVAEKKSA